MTIQTSKAPLGARAMTTPITASGATANTRNRALGGGLLKEDNHLSFVVLVLATTA
jgi:hypothetical protein